MRVLLVTGGAGFIGSNFIKFFLSRNKNFIVVNIDSLSNNHGLRNLKELEDSPRYHFVKSDLNNYELLNYVLRRFRPEFVINFASKSGLGKTYASPQAISEANISGTMALLEGVRNIWGRNSFKGNRYIQVSDSAVYGSGKNQKDENYITEDLSISPDSLYAASKASADMLVQAYCKSYGLPGIITRSCTNYGPYQPADCFIPSAIINAINDNPIVLSHDGFRKKEHIFVLDHCAAIIKTLFFGKAGEIYNIGTGERMSEYDLAKNILKVLEKPSDLLREDIESSSSGEDNLLDCRKLKYDINWSSKFNGEEGIKEVVRWYQRNENYWKNI